MSHRYSDNLGSVNNNVRHSDDGGHYPIAMAKTLSEGGSTELLELLKRKARELGQGPLATKLGIRQGYLSEILSGKRNPGAKVLQGLKSVDPQGLAGVLGVQLEIVQREPETFEEWAEALGIDPHSQEADALRTSFKDLQERKQVLEFAAAETRRRQAAAKGKLPSRGEALKDIDETGIRAAAKPKAKKSKGQ